MVQNCPCLQANCGYKQNRTFTLLSFTFLSFCPLNTFCTSMLTHNNCHSFVHSFKVVWESRRVFYSLTWQCSVSRASLIKTYLFPKQHPIRTCQTAIQIQLVKPNIRGVCSPPPKLLPCKMIWQLYLLSCYKGSDVMLCL